MGNIEEKNNNKKIFWWVFFSIMTIIISYMFVVVYFFYISPYNIIAKLVVWPFNSEESISKFYSDATVQIDYSYKDNQTKEDITVSTVGVNVRENGVLISVYDIFRDCDENTEFFISANNGKNYIGKLIYGDLNYNLAVIKCENLENVNEEIKLPYVNIANISKILTANKLFISTSPKNEIKSWIGALSSNDEIFFDTIVELSDGLIGVDLVMENCFVFNFDKRYAFESINANFTGGAVLDGSGNLLGFSYGNILMNNNEFVGYSLIPVQNASLFIDVALNSYYNNTVYKNELVENTFGLDKIEVECHLSVSETDSGNVTSFYKNGTWIPYLDSMIKYNNCDMNGGFFLIDDLVYNDEIVLSKENVISKIKVDDVFYTINTKIDLMNVFYSVKEGQKIIIYYHSMQEQDDTTIENETSEFIL